MYIGPNVLTDNTLGISESLAKSLAEVKDFVVNGFRWACNEGPLCEERVRGVKMQINDVTLHTDEVYRRLGQLAPLSRRVTYASIYLASPTLLEPVYLVTVTCPRELTSVICDLLAVRRGKVIEECDTWTAAVVKVKAHLPVSTSFDFPQAVLDATTGAAFCDLQFDHWEPLEVAAAGDFKDPATPLGKMIRAIRERKGLTPELPFDRYLSSD